MKMKRNLYILSILLAVLLGGCSDDGLFDGLTPEQESLLGRAVNFNVSVADEFKTRATGYSSNDNGSFNQNDRMRIYRNYWDKDNNKWSDDIAYRTYYYKYKYGAGDIDLGKDWLPEKGRRGYDLRKNADETTSWQEFTQEENDSLTWDNGTTLRFRAWSLSNYHNALKNASNTYFYADFCVADWVNASGPTQGIPLVLKHQGSRLRFQMLDSGNEFNKIEICANIDVNGNPKPDAWKDYKYPDNHDVNDNDNSGTEAGKTDEQAQLECNLVTEAFMRMCMPAGVDMTTGHLLAVKSASWNNLTTTQVRALEDQDPSIFVKYGTLPPTGDAQTENISATVKHPFFSVINGYPNMITIPYDMSTDLDKQGEVITLPACTRFRVYLYDVNNGDGFGTSGYEGKYHIFALSDVKKKNENNQDVPAFPEGLKLEAGASYTFKVGYRYGGLYVVVDNDLSWENEELPDVNSNDENDNYLISSNYGWWKQAIHDAIPTGTEDFNPVFRINDETEFYEFIRLVNGDAGEYGKNHPLYRLVKSYKQIPGGGVEPDEYGWSRTNSQFNPDWVEESEAELEGYIFFDHYYAANADKPAYSDRDYLKGPYPFYDDNLRRNFNVILKNDLDLKDIPLASVGNTSATPFMGNFDGYYNGQVHTIKNVNMNSGYIFGFIDGKATNGAAVTNLKIESVHNTALLNVGVNPIYIAGISLHAPSSGNSIATSLSMASGVTGTSYVVGCIHVGDAGGPLVGTASDMNMFGCMQVAQGLGTGGALIGTDANSPTVFKPQYSLSLQKTGTNVNAKPSFKNFMCNYYDKTISSGAHAVGTTADDYSLLEYIRGSTTDILCAKNDLLLEDVSMSMILSKSNYYIYYGLAPWKAMNYAIYWYNKNRGSKHPCNVHYESNSVGYNHRYPTLESQDPSTKYGETKVTGWNPTEQPN